MRPFPISLESNEIDVSSVTESEDSEMLGSQGRCSPRQQVETRIIDNTVIRETTRTKERIR